jgi:hypothetical protein
MPVPTAPATEPPRHHRCAHRSSSQSRESAPAQRECTSATCLPTAGGTSANSTSTITPPSLRPSQQQPEQGRAGIVRHSNTLPHGKRCQCQQHQQYHATIAASIAAAARTGIVRHSNSPPLPKQCQCQQHQHYFAAIAASIATAAAGRGRQHYVLLRKRCQRQQHQHPASPPLRPSQQQP